eukprot:g45084.t1
MIAAQHGQQWSVLRAESMNVDAFLLVKWTVTGLTEQVVVMEGQRASDIHQMNYSAEVQAEILGGWRSMSKEQEVGKAKGEEVEEAQREEVRREQGEEMGKAQEEGVGKSAMQFLDKPILRHILIKYNRPKFATCSSSGLGVRESAGQQQTLAGHLELRFLVSPLVQNLQDLQYQPKLRKGVQQKEQ